MAADTPIMVECMNCGHGHLWIPKEVQEDFDRQIKQLQADVAWQELNTQKLVKHVREMLDRAEQRPLTDLELIRDVRNVLSTGSKENNV